jgi:mono/diheme cytochrome c family protein
VEAGEEVFRVTCSRCHTVTGVNSVLDRLHDMYGVGPWERDTVKYYVRGMHTVRPFMPPFPGTDLEAGALVDYLIAMRQARRPLSGAQDAGVSTPSRPPAAPVSEGGA